MVSLKEAFMQQYEDSDTDLVGFIGLLSNGTNLALGGPPWCPWNVN